MGKKETLISIGDANTELAASKHSEDALPSLETANAELKKKSQSTPPEGTIPVTSASELESANMGATSGAEGGTSPVEAGGLGSSLPDVNNDLNAGILSKKPAAPTNPFLEQAQGLAARVNTPQATAQPDKEVLQGLSTVTSHQTAGDVNGTGGTTFDQSLVGKGIQKIFGSKDLTRASATLSNLAAAGARAIPYASDFLNRTLNTVIPGLNLPSDAAKTNNPTANFFEDVSKRKNEEVERRYKEEGLDKDIGDYMNPMSPDFDLSKGFSKIRVEAVGSMPYAIAMATGAGAGLSTAELAGAGTAMFGAEEKQALLEQNKANAEKGLPTLTDEQINNVSAISGAINGVGEAAFGNVKFGGIYKKLIEGGEKKAVEEGVKKILKDATKQYMGTVGEEGLTEGAQRLLENMNNKYIKGDKDVGVMDGVYGDMLVGAFSAGTMGAPILPITALQVARKRLDQKEAKEHADKQAVLKEVLNSGAAPETKEQAVKTLKTSIQEEDELTKKITEEHRSLTDEDRKSVDDLLNQEHGAINASQDPNISEAARDEFKAQAESHAKAVDTIYEQSKEKKADEAKYLSTDEKEELDYLEAVKKDLPLEEHEQKRFDELSAKQERPKPNNEENKREPEAQKGETISTGDLRRPNGSVGTQGFTEENLQSLIGHIATEMGVELPVFDKSKGSSELRQLIDFLKGDEKAKQKVFDYVKNNPVEVNTLPDGTYHVQDGNHRANLLNLIGSEEIPVVKNKETTKTEEHVIQKPISGTLLSGTQEGAGETRSERSGVEHGEQGTEAAKESVSEKPVEQKEKITKSNETTKKSTEEKPVSKEEADLHRPILHQHAVETSDEIKPVLTETETSAVDKLRQERAKSKEKPVEKTDKPKSKFTQLSPKEQLSVSVGDEIYYLNKKEGKYQKHKVSEVTVDRASDGSIVGVRYNIGDNKNPFTPNGNNFYKKEEPKSEAPTENKLPEGEKVKISGKEFIRTVDDKGVHDYTAVADGVKLPRETEKYRQLEEARRGRNVEKPVSENEETAHPEAKAKVKAKDELTDQEEDSDSATTDKPEALDKLNREIASLQQTKDPETKFKGFLARAWKAQNAGDISRATYTAYRDAAVKMLTGTHGDKGKLNLKKEEAVVKANQWFDDVKKRLLGDPAGYKKIVLSAGAPITPQVIADVIELARNLTLRGINAGHDAKTAIDNALKAIMKHPAYKKLAADKNFDTEAFENEVTKGFIEEEPVVDKKEPKKEKEYNPKEKKKGVKSVFKHIFESDNVSEESKKTIEKLGLIRDVKNNKEASEDARKIVDEIGASQAMLLAKDKNTNIPGSTRAMVFGHILSDMNEAERKAKTPEDKDRLAEMQANLAMTMEDFFIEFDRQSAEAGRFSSVINEFYKMSPLGMKKKLAKEIDNSNKKRKKSMKATNSAFTDLKNELNSIEEQGAPKKVAPKKNLASIKKDRKELFGKLRASFNNLGFAATPENIAKVQKEQLDIIFDIAKTYFDEGIVRTQDILKKLSKSVKKETGYLLNGNNNTDLEYILNKEYESGKTFKEAIKEREEKVAGQARQEKMEQRMFKQDAAEERARNKEEKTRTEEQKVKAIQKALAKRKKPVTRNEADRLLEIYNKGVPKEFEDAFYEKFGFINPNSPEISKKIGEFGEKIANAPEGVLKNNEKVKYLNWLKDYKKNKLVEAGFSYWYANILSSYETHLRNIQFNGITSLFTMPMLLGQKALAKGNVKDAIGNYAEFFRSFGEGATEASGMIKTGQTSRFEDVAPSNVLERSKWTKAFVYPGRFLRAEDVLFTTPLYNMKQKEIFTRMYDEKIKQTGRTVSKEERQKAINELMGNTEERIEKANKTASEDIEKIYGPDWQKNKEAVLNHKIRVNEIVDQSRPQEVREEARKWAKKALLTNKPEGFFGVLSDGIGFFLNYLPPLRFAIPFINVPLNITNQIIERSPLGFVNVVKGKTFIGDSKYSRELSKDEIKELRMKATNYSILLGATVAAVAAAKGFGDDDDDASCIVTGKEGGYFKNQAIQKGGGLDPYTIYLGGKDGIKINYQNTPLASIFAPVGYFRDYQKYEEVNGQKNLTDGITHSFLGYLNQVIDAASMKGLKEIFKYMDADERKKMEDDGYKKRVAKTLSTMIPYSGMFKAITKDTKGLLGADEKTSTDFMGTLTNGLPFDYYQDSKIDAFGRPIKSQFIVPLVPYEKKNLSEQGEKPDEYYEEFRKKEYDVSNKFRREKTAYTDQKGEFEMTQKELYDFNKVRGHIALDLLQKKNEDGERIWDIMKKESKEKFAEDMDAIFKEAMEMAKIQVHALNGKLPQGKTIGDVYDDYIESVKKDKKEPSEEEDKVKEIIENYKTPQ